MKMSLSLTTLCLATTKASLSLALRTIVPWGAKASGKIGCNCHLLSLSKVKVVNILYINQSINGAGALGS